jgi:zinc protease
MALKKSIFWYVLLLSGCLFAQDVIPQNLAPDVVIPVDPLIRTGVLKNGFRYYIRVNKKPENRAELRLGVNAGSVLENEKQLGLAHFTEHMAFNGTKNFEKQELVNYLESVGMRFGPDLNAYTSFDETVYMLQIPTDSIQIIHHAFQILEDWAHNISFDDREIDKERGVIIEEWRLRRGADARMRDKQLPILFKGSRYADRLPIGDPEIIKSFKYQTLKDFYHTWYRPDLMAIVAVGDFDPDSIQHLIEVHFSNISEPPSPENRPLYPVPDNKGTLFAIASDPEATRSSVSVYFKHEVQPQARVEDYRRMLVEDLYNSALNTRLSELVQQADPPFLFGYSSEGRYIRSKEFYTLSAGVAENGVERGLEALLTEAERVRRFGFTETELEREKTDMLRGLERAYNERDKSESRSYAAEYLRNYFEQEPIPGIAYEYDLAKIYVPGITVDEVNRLAQQWITPENRVVLANVPQKEGIEIPTEDELSAVFKAVAAKEISPYLDKVSEEPLVDNIPAPGKIVSERTVSDMNITEWRLSNGVRVVLKPTNFKNDEIRMSAFSPGGNSLYPDSAYIPAITATQIIGQSGLGKFDLIALQKKLTGKVAGATPYIGELEEGFYGSAAPKDLETLFQMIYLYFYEPRIDSTAFLSYVQRMKGFLQNRNASPDAAYQDTIQYTMGSHNYRSRPWSDAMFNELDMKKSFTIYKDRFADASDFTFLFVGNFAIDSIKTLVTTYLAKLPSIKREENWRDIGVRTPEGIIDKKIYKGVEQKSKVQIHFSGLFDWSEQNEYDLDAMAEVLRIKLREVLREDMGGTYGVSVSAFGTRIPDQEFRVIISFGCDPARVDELTHAVWVQVDSLRNYPVNESYIEKVREIQRREREKDLKENRFWIGSLEDVYFYHEDPHTIYDFDKEVRDLTADAVQSAADKYLEKENVATFVLYPRQDKQ